MTIERTMANPFIKPQTPNSMPDEWAVQDRDLEYQRRMAEKMAEDSQPPQGGMVGSIYVAPAWTQMLAKALNPVLAQQRIKSLDEKQRSLADSRTSERMGTLDKFSKAMSGTPEEVLPEGVFGPAAPAVPGNRNVALSELGKSRDPMLQNLYMSQMLKGMEPSKYGNTPHYDQSGKAYVLDDRGNVKYLDGVAARDKVELAPSGVAYNPFQTKPGQVFNDPNKLIGLDPETSQPFVNQPLLDAKKQVSKAGAANVSVKTDVKTGEGLAKEVGPMVAASKAGAEGAVQQLGTIKSINGAIDSGKLIAGPGANVRMQLAQVANVLGVGGKDNAEVLSNTRTAIQGLAKFSLEGRSSLKGQGQISDYEGKLLAKATSGDIADLTIPELKVLTSVAKRVSEAQIANHQHNMKVMRSKPDLNGVADFYEVPGAATTAPASPAAGGGFKILGVEGR